MRASSRFSHFLRSSLLVGARTLLSTRQNHLVGPSFDKTRRLLPGSSVSLCSLHTAPAFSPSCSLSFPHTLYLWILTSASRVLFLFLALIRTHSSALLVHWAQVEPLGYFYKGYQQHGRKSTSGGFICTLPLCWDNQDKIYERNIATFNERLRNEPIVLMMA